MAARRKLYKRILVAIDFSEGSRRALEQAVATARLHDAEVEAVYVAEQFQPSLPFLKSNREAVGRLQRRERKRASGELDAFVADAGGPVKTRVLFGIPDRTLLEHARRRRADLMVLSNRGNRLAQRLGIGTVAEHVIRDAKIPVLLVPGPARARGKSR